MAGVREATSEDFPALVTMGRKFHQASPWSRVSTFDEEAFRHSLVWLMDAPNGVLLTSGEGMIGGLVFPLFFNSAAKVAQELFWWAEDGQGRALLSEFERVAKVRGANVGVMGALDGLRDSAVGRLLMTQGYLPTEHMFMKGL